MSESTETKLSSRPILAAKVVAPPEPRWVVLVMLFVLMGALAIPMLWRSPHFSRPTKVVLTVLAVVQTIVVLIILALVVSWFVAQISHAWTHRSL